MTNSTTHKARKTGSRGLSHALPSCRIFAAACCVVITALTLFKSSYSQSRPPARVLTSVTNSARKIDKIMENGRSELRLPGVSIAIMRDHRLMFAKGYGLADRAANTRATAHTIYAIGSLSKQFTAAAIMKLDEENRLQIDQPVTRYLAKYPASQTSVPKIRNLLQQNSGLPAWDDLPEFQDVDTANSDRFELSKLIDVIARQPLLFSPGEWWSYSNSNYTVLAGIVEQVTGTKHDEYLVDAFLNRLDLRSIGGCASSRVSLAGQRALGYQDSRSYALRPVTAVKAIAFTGAGGLCSNVIDLVKWMRALVDGQVVNLNSFRQMTTVDPVRAGFTPPYGFGVSLLPISGQRTVWHTGVLSGYTAVLAYFPEHDLIISVLANARRAHVDQIMKDVVRELLGLQAPRLRDLPIASTEAELIAGIYDDKMFKFRIFRSGAELFIDVPPAGTATRLMNQGKREFATGRPTDFRLRFEPEVGEVERVVWEWTELRAYGQRIR